MSSSPAVVNVDMKALIIAAGMGSRLSPLAGGRPKPLVKLLGLSIIERVILAAREAGVKEFVVVVGYQEDKIREELGDGRRYGVDITYVENREWWKGNALSVLKARALFSRRFLLLMSDHLFDPSILRDVMTVDLEDDESLLVVDGAPKGHVDMEDATKVLVRQGRVMAISKALQRFNAVDCGIFSCSPSLFDAIEESLAEGEGSLSSAMERLAERGKLKAYDLEGRFWIDIDTEEAFSKAEEILCKELTKPTDGFISRHVNRPLSRRISKLLVNTGLTPDAISFSTFLLSLAGALLLSLGDFRALLAGGLLVQVSSILDGCDGEIARLKFMASDRGGWFDSVLDRYADAAVLLGLTFGAANNNNDPLVWTIGYLALIGSFMNSYTAIKYDTLVGRSGKRQTWRFGRDTRSFLIMLGAVSNQVVPLLLFLAVVTNFVSLRRLILLRRG